MPSVKTADKEASLDRFRVAMKFSLWTWALYWPGGGILLLTGGLDPISIAVVVASFASFVYLLSSGALNTEHSRNMKQFLLERPLYLVAILGLLALFAPLLTALETVGLMLFSAVYLGAVIYAIKRLVEYYKIQGKPFMESKVDQAFIALGLAGLTSGIIFLDTWLYAIAGTAVSGPPATVALANWVSLLYPALILMATKPIRAPLQKPRLFRRKDKAPSPEPIAAKA